MIPEISERVLVCAPVGRDAAIAASLLTEAGLLSAVCPSLSHVLDGLRQGAGTALLTEEGLDTANLNPLVEWLRHQPEWSDFPFVLLTRKGGGIERNPAAMRFLDTLGNVTFLERPFHPTTLVSLAQAALRGRRRQYEARARLEDLHRGAAKYRSLFDSIDAGFCLIEMIFGADGAAVDYRYLEANPAFMRQTGRDDLVGRTMRSLIPDAAPDWCDVFGRVAQTGEHARFERPAPQGWFDIYAFRIGTPPHAQVAVLFNDITDQKRGEQALREGEERLRRLNETLEQRVLDRTRALEAAQEALRQSQKLESMGQLTGGVAHDFNNLLTPIMGSLDLLQRRGVGSEREQRLIEGALQSAERARTLVQRLLAFARRQPLEARPVDIGQLLAGIRDLIVSTCGPRIRVDLAISQEMPPAKADANQIEMAIINLAVNARDAMPDGGALTIEAVLELVASPRHRPALPSGWYIRISVRDTGAGMDAETQSKAIEPFFTTKGLGLGTGLGLSMVHGLAAQLGGGLGIASVSGEGTTVDLWLPVTEDRLDDTAAPADPADAPRFHGSALIVDDEDIVRASTAHMLAEMGYTVTEAASAEQALALLGGGLAVDLLVTDHLMPGMSGIDLAGAVQATWPAIRVLLVSGYAEASGSTLPVPFLAKPFVRDDLAARLAKL